MSKKVVIDNRHKAHEEWTGMPEFVQNKKEEYAKVIVRFETEEDLQDFAKLIGQTLTKKTKSAWHPAKSHWRDTKEVYVDGEVVVADGDNGEPSLRDFFE